MRGTLENGGLTLGQSRQLEGCLNLELRRRRRHAIAFHPRAWGDYLFHDLVPGIMVSRRFPTTSDSLVFRFKQATQQALTRAGHSLFNKVTQ